ATDARPAVIEATAAEHHEKNNQYQQQAHGSLNPCVGGSTDLPTRLPTTVSPGITAISSPDIRTCPPGGKHPIRLICLHAMGDLVPLSGIHAIRTAGLV
ncbi:MAG: hypothetical protein Q8L75_00480, partial [Acidobacteriota bacterium]|nr:hypothetical protein [Acidobacteriota bacterium]